MGQVLGIVLVAETEPVHRIMGDEHKTNFEHPAPLAQYFLGAIAQFAAPPAAGANTRDHPVSL